MNAEQERMTTATNAQLAPQPNHVPTEQPVLSADTKGCRIPTGDGSVVKVRTLEELAQVSIRVHFEDSSEQSNGRERVGSDW